jgi:hypothetical protein
MASIVHDTLRRVVWIFTLYIEMIGLFFKT